MLTVTEIKGRFVSSSVPKPLILPVSTRHSKTNKLKRNVRSNSSQYCDELPELSADTVFYAKARQKKNPIDAETNLPLIHGDGECRPVQGREHLPIQTDIYLEELCDLIEEADAQCETDPLLDRPASPLFVPQSSGDDVATQIYPGDLFDFDREVQPLLECLVGETIEQSLLEVSAEEEVARLEDQHKEFEVRRNADVAECLRLEEEERRLLEEKRRRLKEQDEAIQLEEEMSKKVAACVFAQDYLSDLLPKVYKRLESQGYFITQDKEIQEVEENFWPWLIDEVDSEIQTLQTSCGLLDNMIEDVAQNITETSVIRPVTPDEYPEKTEVEVPSEEGDDLASENAEPTSDSEQQ